MIYSIPEGQVLLIVYTHTDSRMGHQHETELEAVVVGISQMDCMEKYLVLIGASVPSLSTEARYTEIKSRFAYEMKQWRSAQFITGEEKGDEEDDDYELEDDE